MNIESIKMRLGAIQEHVSDLEEDYLQCKAKINLIEDMMLDNDHSLELDKNDGVKLVQLAKERAGLRKLRRKYKDKLTLHKTFRGTYNSGNAKQIIRAFNDQEHTLHSRSYTQRVDTTIKQELLEEVSTL